MENYMTYEEVLAILKLLDRDLNIFIRCGFDEDYGDHEISKSRDETITTVGEVVDYIEGRSDRDQIAKFFSWQNDEEYEESRVSSIYDISEVEYTSKKSYARHSIILH